MSKEEVFLNQLNNKINKFEEESTVHKHDHRRYRYCIYTLTAITSVFSGLALSFSNMQVELNIGILIVGAATGIITSIESMKRPHDLWIMERNVYYSLLDLKEEYEFQAAGESAVDIDEYHSKMQEVLNASKDKWSRKLKLEAKPNKQSQSDA